MLLFEIRIVLIDYFTSFFKARLSYVKVVVTGFGIVFDIHCNVDFFIVFSINTRGYLSFT